MWVNQRVAKATVTQTKRDSGFDSGLVHNLAKDAFTGKKARGGCAGSHILRKQMQEIETMKSFKADIQGPCDHSYAVALWKWVDPKYDEEIKTPQGFTLEFVPFHMPGSQVNTAISIPFFSGDELDALIRVLQDAQKAYEAYNTIAAA